jgi:hypothetical protein
VFLFESLEDQSSTNTFPGKFLIICTQFARMEEKHDFLKIFGFETNAHETLQIPWPCQHFSFIGFSRVRRKG